MRSNSLCELHAKWADEGGIAKSRLGTLERDTRWRWEHPSVRGDNPDRTTPSEWNHNRITNADRSEFWRQVIVESLPLGAGKINSNANRLGRLTGSLAPGQPAPAHTVIRRSGCLARSASTIFSTCAAASSG